MNPDRAIEHGLCHARRHDFDHCNLGPCGFVANNVHHMRCFQCEQTPMLDLHVAENDGRSAHRSDEQLPS
jgi:hypothetical protein